MVIIFILYLNAIIIFTNCVLLNGIEDWDLIVAVLYADHPQRDNKHIFLGEELLTYINKCLEEKNCPELVKKLCTKHTECVKKQAECRKEANEYKRQHKEIFNEYQRLRRKSWQINSRKWKLESQLIGLPLLLILRCMV